MYYPCPMHNDSSLIYSFTSIKFLHRKFHGSNMGYLVLNLTYQYYRLDYFNSYNCLQDLKKYNLISVYVPFI